MPPTYACTVEVRCSAAAVGLNLIEMVPLVPLWSWHGLLIHGSTLTLFMEAVGF